MNYEEWEFHPSRLPEDFIEKEKALDALRQQFREELRQNEKATKYLAGYGAKWREKFIEDYAKAKIQAVAHAEYVIEAADTDPELRYRDQTEAVFDMILQKKLFNVQLLWRAEQLAIPEIRICQDFLYWEQNLRTCPFLEPVTAEEVALMQEFLASEYPIDAEMVSDFEEMRERNEEGDYEYLPEWYAFYDSRMGTGPLMELPDLRGPKEEIYRALGRTEQQEKVKAALAANPPLPPVAAEAYIHCGMEERYKFSKVVDDEIFQRIFRQQLDDMQEFEDAEEADGVYDIDTIIMDLQRVKNPPPVRGGLNWREALVRCWQDYINTIIANELEQVFDEYQLYHEMGLTGQTKDDPFGYRALADDAVKLILRGRELSGEPADLDF